MSTKSSTAKPHASIRLFKNPILEALTHVHPSIPFIVWIPIVLYFLAISYSEAALSVGTIVLYAALGVVFWTVTEYTLHRHLFHFKATTRVGQYLVFLFHGIHHDDPQDPTRLVMPPVVSIALSIPFFYGFKFAMGDAGMAFFAGFISGYLVYDYLHFAIHHFRPRTEWGKDLKEHHMKHHFIAHGAKWGVSSTFWDRVFGTMK